mgnify:CR=1 FL=1
MWDVNSIRQSRIYHCENSCSLTMWDVNKEKHSVYESEIQSCSLTMWDVNPTSSSMKLSISWLFFNYVGCKYVCANAAATM